MFKLEEIIKESITGEYSIKPIGHHKLGRHYVYEINRKNDSEYILKIYGKPFRFFNEITGLNLLKEYIECPQVINRSESCSDVEWLMMNKIEGVVLESVWDSISDDNKVYLIIKLGELLGKIHSFYKYEYYGSWGSTQYSNKDFLNYRKEKDRTIIRDIVTQHLPEEELLLYSYYELTKYYQRIDSSNIPRLCHHDFSARNVLVVFKDKQWEINGLIDFEHCYPDDPDIDFTDLFLTIFMKDPHLIKYFFNGYSTYLKVSNNLEIKMKYYLINKGLSICSWAHDCAIDYYNDGINLLKNLLLNT